jgi:hypothetical protein
MKLLKYNARFSKDDDNFKTWKMVNEVIQQNMTPEIRERWMDRGYEGLATECVLEHYGINRIYRDEQQSMTFEFTEQQWTWFLLRWL